MTPVKRRVNATYHWMEGNVVTAILVSSGLSAALAVALVGALGLYSSATYQPKTACSKDPAGRECAELRLEVAKAEPLQNPCTSYQRVTGRKGRNCKRRFVGERQAQAKSKEVQDLEVGGQGAEPVVGRSPSPAPPDPGTGEVPAPQKPGGDAPKAPPAPGSDEPTSAPAPVTSSPPLVAPSPSPQAPEPEPPGLLTPALTPVLERVCSVADRLVHLC